MELSHQVPASISDQYATRFGEAGAFDRALFPEVATLALMAEALRRDSPVTDDDLEAAHQTLYRQPMPAPGQAVVPSGYGVPETPAPPQDERVLFAAIPPVEMPSPALPETPARQHAEEEERRRRQEQEEGRR
jgi:hypothetical protein